MMKYSWLISQPKAHVTSWTTSLKIWAGIKDKDYPLSRRKRSWWPEQTIILKTTKLIKTNRRSELCICSETRCSWWERRIWGEDKWWLCNNSRTLIFYNRRSTLAFWKGNQLWAFSMSLSKISQWLLILWPFQPSIDLEAPSVLKLEESGIVISWTRLRHAQTEKAMYSRSRRKEQGTSCIVRQMVWTKPAMVLR